MYSQNLQHLCQQKNSRFRGAVRVEPIKGKYSFFNQLGAVEATKRTGRRQDKDYDDPPTARRRVAAASYDYDALVEDLDTLLTLQDPTGPYTVAAQQAMLRSMDDVVIEAATGTAYTGEEGTTQVVLPAAQKIAVTVDPISGKTNSGMSLGKLSYAKYLFDLADVDPEIERFMALGARQAQDLLALEKLTSNEYAAVKALVDGQITKFMGFTFIPTQRLAHNTSTDIRTCVAWVKDGILLGVGQEISVDIGKIRTKKGNPMGITVTQNIGATRMEENKVVEIPCDESPA